MLAFVGQVNRSFAGFVQASPGDRPRQAAMRPFAKWAALEIPSADQAPEVMARAINVATSGTARSGGHLGPPRRL